MSVEFYENYCKSNQINCDQNITAALTKSLTTHEVCMSGITINAQNCEALGATLYTCDDIHRLDLSNSLLPVPGLSSLLEKLSGCHLSVLNLKGNNISGSATLMLSRLLTKNTTIKVLSLEWNNIGVPLPMFSKFCNALINNHTLEVLDLKNNELNVECAVELADVILHNTSLKDIDLRWNCIGVEGGQNLLKALNSNTVMHILRIQGNGIPTDIMSAIDNTVKHNSTVQKINDEYAARQDLLTRQIKVINQKRIEDFRTVCEQGVQQLQPCLDKIKEYSIERRRLIEDIEQSNIKILQLEELVTGLSAQVDGANKQIEFKQTIIYEQEKKIDEIRNQYETDLELLKSKFSEEENKLKNEIEGFQTIIEKERDSRFLLEKQLRDSQFSVETLIKETEDLKERVSNVTSIHNKVIEEERTINKENLDRLLEEMKSQQVQANERLEILKRENGDKIGMLENKLFEAEKDKQNLNEVLLNERRKWIEEKSSIFAEASQKQAEILKSIDEQVDQVKDEKAKVEQELRETKSLVKTLARENENIKSEFTECMSNLSLLQNQLSESKSALEHLQREHSKISKIDETFKEEADKYKSELIRAHRMITDLQMDNNSLTDKHRKEVSELSSKLQDKIEEVSRMRAEEIERAQGLYAAIHKYVGGKC